MNEFAIEALAQVTKARFAARPGGASNFAGVSTDSRTIRPGDCFFAICGENFDGHDYVNEAFAKGAVCAVVSREIHGCESSDRPLLKVGDTIKALGDLAREYRRQAGFKVVAITGSVGKTMTRHITYHVLSRHFRVFVSPKNYNNNIGLPLTLLGADPEHEIVVAEMGSNHPGEIAYLTRIAQPDIALVTNIQPAHLEGFGNLETVAREKLSICEGLGRDGVLIIHTDAAKWLNDKRLDYRLPIAGQEVRTFGTSDGCDHQVRDIVYDGFSSRFTIEGRQISLPVAGPGNVQNALASWAVCSRLGLTIDDFAQAVKTVRGIAMRAERLQVGTLTVLQDCYNANPASMRNALQILRNLNPKGARRSVFVCGDMAELGEYAESLHAELGTAIAKANVQVLLAVGNYANVTAESAKNAAPYELQTKCFQDVLSACNNLQEFVKDYDIILVKGSRTARLELVGERLKQLFA